MPVYLYACIPVPIPVLFPLYTRLKIKVPIQKISTTAHAAQEGGVFEAEVACVSGFGKGEKGGKRGESVCVCGSSDTLTFLHCRGYK